MQSCTDSARVGSSLAFKQTWAEATDNDKHSSLLQNWINGDRNNFYITDPWFLLILETKRSVIKESISAEISSKMLFGEK